jgi:uncharacterized membrane protein required for colicin V production
MKGFEAIQYFISFGIVVTCLALGALAGFRLRLFRSVLSFATLVAASLVALAFGDTASGLLQGFAIPPGWSHLAGYAAVFGTILVGLPALLELTMTTAVMTFPMLIDRLGGALVGAAAGMLLSSIVRVGFAMAPVAAEARPSPEQMQHDITPRFLSIVASIMTSDPALRRAWLRGREWKPAAGDAANAGLTWSEPFVDVNDNKRFDRDEPFLDKDGNESFTRTFVSKLPDDGGPLIGVMERYWLGSWQLVQVEESTP